MTLDDATAATRLPAADLDRARAWYSEKLGLEPAEEREGGIRYLLNGSEFCLFASSGHADGSFTQLSLTVHDIESTVRELRARGVVFEEYDSGLVTVDGIAEVEGNYPSKGTGERASWFRDSEGNLIGMAQSV